MSYRWIIQKTERPIDAAKRRGRQTRTAKVGTRREPMFDLADVEGVRRVAKSGRRVGPGAVRKQRQAELEAELEARREARIRPIERIAAFVTSGDDTAAPAVGNLRKTSGQNVTRLNDGTVSKRKRVSYADPRALAEAERVVNSRTHHSPSASGSPLL